MSELKKLTTAKINALIKASGYSYKYDGRKVLKEGKRYVDFEAYQIVRGFEGEALKIPHIIRVSQNAAGKLKALVIDNTLEMVDVTKY